MEGGFELHEYEGTLCLGKVYRFKLAVFDA